MATASARAVVRTLTRVSSGPTSLKRIVTSAFGGGGHPRAAGCTVDLPLDRARAAVLAECDRQLVDGDARGR